MCFFLGHKNLEYPLGVRDVEEFGDEHVCPGCSCHVCSSMDEMAVLYLRLLNQKQTCDILAGSCNGRKIAQFFFKHFFSLAHQWNRNVFVPAAVLLQQLPESCEAILDCFP